MIFEVAFNPSNSMTVILQKHNVWAKKLMQSEQSDYEDHRDELQPWQTEIRGSHCRAPHSISDRVTGYKLPLGITGSSWGDTRWPQMDQRAFLRAIQHVPRAGY